MLIYYRGGATNFCLQNEIAYRQDWYIFQDTLSYLSFRQIALADVIIINKLDLVSKEEVTDLRKQVRFDFF